MMGQKAVTFYVIMSKRFGYPHFRTKKKLFRWLRMNLDKSRKIRVNRLRHTKTGLFAEEKSRYLHGGKI
jgi:hypothetical protein